MTIPRTFVLVCSLACSTACERTTPPSTPPPLPLPLCEPPSPRSSPPDEATWADILRNALDENGDMVVADAGDGRSIVWVRTTHFEDGDAEGPIALVQLDAEQAIVHSLGWLRSPASNLRMRLVGDWLVVEGVRCWPHYQCQPVAHLLAREQGALVGIGLERDDGSCVAPEVDLLDWARIDLREGVREFRVERELRFGEAGTPIIHERLVVRDYGSASPGVVREATRDRPLTRDGASLRGPPSLWTELQTEELIELEPVGPSLIRR